MSGEFEEFQKFLMEEMKNSYSEKAMEHLLHPKNVGELEDASSYGVAVDTHGDVLEIWLKIESDIITKAGFFTEGCLTMVAAGSAATELVKGMSTLEAGKLTGEDILKALNGLPEKTEHCAHLAANAVRGAVSRYIFLKSTPWHKPNYISLKLNL